MLATPTSTISWCAHCHCVAAASATVTIPPFIEWNKYRSCVVTCLLRSCASIHHVPLDAGGADVYQGVHIDYKGDDVNAETFLAVLEGNTKAVAGKGSGRVVASGPRDRVFLFYSDHGAAGVLGMPTGPFLYADQLMNTLHMKYHARGFKEFVM